MACKEVVLKVNINAEKNKYSIMFMLREHKSGQNYRLKMGRKSFGDVIYFKY
jgi:hypothetical protein